MALLLTCLGAAGFAIFVLGLQTMLMFPLAVAHEIWKRAFFRKHGQEYTPFVSVIVPAYNEERTIGAAVDSILRSDYPAYEVIVIDDGSTDATAAILAPLRDAARITLLAKPNGGKASALNAGIAVARGEVVFCTDADSVFRPDTIRKIARWFVDPEIHAVCGNDTPLDPRGPLRKLLAVTTHIGTGFVRRALSMLRVIPVISGNACAVRKEYVRRVGGFTEIWGEDLDLTMKLHREHARIVYDSDALVLCETPGTLGALWKQRVRWTRSYLKITALHRDMMFSPGFFPFSWYLPLNWFNLIGVPLLQLFVLAGALLLPSAGSPFAAGVMQALAYIGFGSFLAVALVSVLLDGAPRHIWYVLAWGWLIIPLSYFYDAVVCTSIGAELSGAAEHWAKAERRQAGAVALQGFRFRIVARNLALPLGVAALLGVVLLVRTSDRAPAAISPAGSDQPSIVVATHFDAWTDPRDAVTSVFARAHPEILTGVAVGAGRWEWNFFRWRDHDSTWSNDQRLSGGDLLGDAVETAGRKGKGVVAIVDFYAPAYLAKNPAMAARDADNAPSPEQVCFDELVHGGYGDDIRSMVSYIAKSYDVEGISLTELGYGRYCYDARCLESYRRATGRKDWPREFFNGRIDRNDPSIGKWRSEEMTMFLRALADSAHAYGKKLYVDVPVDIDNMEDEGLLSGLHYPDLLTFVDGLVVWDYFYLEGRPASTSEDVARFFVGRYGVERVFISIGLWGDKSPVSPRELSESLVFARRGGARKFWITPNHMMTPGHWDEVVKVFGHKI